MLIFCYVPMRSGMVYPSPAEVRVQLELLKEWELCGVEDSAGDGGEQGKGSGLCLYWTVCNGSTASCHVCCCSYKPLWKEEQLLTGLCRRSAVLWNVAVPQHHPPASPALILPGYTSPAANAECSVNPKQRAKGLWAGGSSGILLTEHEMWSRNRCTVPPMCPCPPGQRDHHLYSDHTTAISWDKCHLCVCVCVAAFWEWTIKGRKKIQAECITRCWRACCMLKA